MSRSLNSPDSFGKYISQSKPIRKEQLYRNVSLQQNQVYEDVEEAEQYYNFDVGPENENEHQAADNVVFPQNSADSQIFLQYLSSSHSMMNSMRNDDSHLLNEKREQEIALNEALDQQISGVRQELQRKNYQIAKLEAIIKGWETRMKNKEIDVQNLEIQIEEKEQQIKKLTAENFDHMKMLQKKDEIFRMLTEQTRKINKERDELQQTIKCLKVENDELSLNIEQLTRNLSIYTDTDRKLYDYKGIGYQQYQSPINTKKNSNIDKIQKQLERIKKEKSVLEVEINAIQQKLEDRQNRSRQIEEDNRKKLSIKDKKIQELEQKIAYHKDEVFKSKNQLEENIEELSRNLTFKEKEIVSLNAKIAQNDKRIRSLLEQSKKKDEKVRDLTLQALDKDKLLNQRNKQLEDMRTKQDFDHHLVSEKEQQIQILMEEKNQLLQQLDIEKSEKRDKIDKADKAEKLKRQRDQDKQKKQYEALKKSLQILQKEKEQVSNSLKECKKKLQQAGRQLKAAKASYAELQNAVKSREAQTLSLKQKADKALKELNQAKKKADMVPELKNKLIILENRLKQNESIMKDSCDFSQSSNLQDKIDALQAKLFERDQELKSLKSMMKANSLQTSDEHEEDLQQLQMELYQKQKIIEQLSQELQQKNQQIQKMKGEVAFKDSTLEFTHKVLVNSEKEKIQLQQEKKILEDMINNNSYEGNKKSVQFYDEQIDHLQSKIYQLQKRLEDQDEKEYEMRKLRQQVKQFKQLMLSKEKKITPETMSQEETVNFLIKTIKKVNRSADMLKLLAKNRELKDLIIKMYPQIRFAQDHRP